MNKFLMFNPTDPLMLNLQIITITIAVISGIVLVLKWLGIISMDKNIKFGHRGSLSSTETLENIKNLQKEKQDIKLCDVKTANFEKILQEIKNEQLHQRHMLATIAGKIGIHLQ